MCLDPRKVEKFMKRIPKIVEALDKTEGGKLGVSVDEFIAFQQFLDNQDQIKSKVAQYKYLDYDMYKNVLDSFSANNAYCKKNKTKISATQATAVFLLMDTDESGELEPEEILNVFTDRKQLGQSREDAAKKDALDFLWKSWAHLKTFVNELSGY